VEFTFLEVNVGKESLDVGVNENRTLELIDRIGVEMTRER
jgi:hypothetical protein